MHKYCTDPLYIAIKLNSKWCAILRIKDKYSSPRHLQANGQVEVTNKTIVKILKKKVGEKKGM